MNSRRKPGSRADGPGTAARAVGVGAGVAVGFVLALALALALETGCQTERVVTRYGRPPAATPRPAPRTPAGAEPHRMALFVGQPDDADGNGYPDLIHVEAALFANEYPMAFAVDGSFVFTLYRRGDARNADAEPIREWRFGPDAASARLMNAIYGRGYRFALSLLDGGTDRYRTTEGDLRGRFEPADGGKAVHTSDEVRRVQFGRASHAARIPSPEDAPRD